MSIVFFTIEDDGPRDGSSLLFAVLAVTSVFINFVLMAWYLFRRPKLSKLREEELIWVKIVTKIGTETTEVIERMQRKEMKKRETPEIKVIELVKVAVTAPEGVYIEYLEKEGIEKGIKHLGQWGGVKSVIKVSEEDESATKDTMEVEILGFVGGKEIKRIKRIKTNTNELQEIKTQFGKENVRIIKIEIDTLITNGATVTEVKKEDKKEEEEMVVVAYEQITTKGYMKTEEVFSKIMTKTQLETLRGDKSIKILGVQKYIVKK